MSLLKRWVDLATKNSSKMDLERRLEDFGDAQNGDSWDCNRVLCS